VADSILGCVIEQLASDDDSIRNVALNWLCEGYMNETHIASMVYSQWDSRTPELAYASFPMLSYFPIPSTEIAEACQRAQAMALTGAELTSLTTRCAGKLLEQTVRLPVVDLVEHWEAINEAIASHKIFFRIHPQALRQRLDFLDKSADQLAELLNEAVAVLGSAPDDVEKTRQGLHSLEVLRTLHPSYLDLSNVLKQHGSNDPSSEASLRLALASLAQFPGREELEVDIAPMLQDQRESVLAMAIEALVHRGSGAAAKAMVEQFDLASEGNRRWIARGLQRMRVHNLAPIIGQMRDRVSDHALWMMLLVAELQQLDPASGPRIVSELKDLEAASQALIDAGTLYTFVCSPLQEELRPLELEECFRELLQRVHSRLVTQPPRPNIRVLRRTQSRQIDRLYNKRRKI
jgi:hypothetical protein